MSYLVRKISNPAKWGEKPYLAGNEISADALTTDLRTTEGRLSFWNTENSARDYFKDIALAIAATWQRIDRMNIVFIDKKLIEQKGISFEDTAGITPLEDFKKYHCEAIHLDVQRIVKVAQCVAQAIRIGNQQYLFTTSEIVEILREGISKKRINIDDLMPDLQSALKEK